MASCDSIAAYEVESREIGDFCVVRVLGSEGLGLRGRFVGSWRVVGLFSSLCVLLIGGFESQGLRFVLIISGLYLPSRSDIAFDRRCSL